MASTRFIWTAMAFVMAGLVALPAASALAVGIGQEANGIGDLKAAGGTVAYGQIWAGTWLRSGWGAFDTGLANIRDSGATPVILWYYWGDSISTSCVANGCNGMSRGDWDGMSTTMATHAKDVMGTKPFLVVLEPEFNKGGISGQPFDGYLAAQSRNIKSIAPSAMTVVGFGSWGGYGNFPQAVAAADYVGFQWMRGSTHETAASGSDAANSILQITKDVRAATGGKTAILFDMAIASYGGWESVQKTSLDGLVARRGELDAAGLMAIVWRYAKDNSLSSGYYGPAESTWGLKYAGGGEKPGWASLVTLARGSSASSLPAAYTPPTIASSAPAPTSNVFTSAKGNEWWEEVGVSGSPTSVSLTVGSAKTPLSRTSWGTWAAGAHATTGTIVTFTATFADGSTRSASYVWPSATPTTATASSTAPAPTPGFSPAFTNVSGNEWWIQVSVSGGPATVSVRVNGGNWVPLQKQSWGDWATGSVHVPSHATVQFQAATAGGAAAATSGITTWP